MTNQLYLLQRRKWS